MATDSENAENEGKEPQRPLLSYLTDPFVILILIGVLCFFFGQYLIPGTIEYERKHVWGIALIMAAIFGRLSWAALKNMSPKIVWQTGYSTTDGHFIKAGNWGIMKLGGVDTNFLKLPGTDGIVIFPLTALNTVGRSAVLVISKELTTLESLPLEVQKAISDFKLPYPYYFGVISQDQFNEKVEVKGDTDQEQMELDRKLSGLKKPDTLTVVRALKEEYRTTTMLKEQVDFKMERTEKFGAGAVRVADNLQRGNKNILDSLKDKEDK